VLAIALFLMGYVGVMAMRLNAMVMIVLIMSMVITVTVVKNGRISGRLYRGREAENCGFRKK